MSGKLVQTILGVLLIVGIAIGAFSYFATAESVEMLASRFDQRGIEDQIRFLQGQIIALKVKYGPDPSRWYDQGAKEFYYKLEADLKMLWAKYRRMTSMKKN